MEREGGREILTIRINAKSNIKICYLISKPPKAITIGFLFRVIELL